MSIEKEIIKKSEMLLKKFRAGEMITEQEYRRLIFCVRLSPIMFRAITKDLERRGMIRMKNGRGRRKFIVIR
jgi:predicted transcriptional regulator